MTEDIAQGIVMRSTGSWYQVRLGDGTIKECRIKGKFRMEDMRTTNPVAVGDQVKIEEATDGTGIIREIGKRRNHIIRKSVNLSRQTHIIAANIDRAYLIVTLAAPPTSTGFIDRFLVTAEAYHIPVTVVFNKTDIYNEKDRAYLEELETIYTNIGYECMRISALNEEDVKHFRNKLTHRVNLLSGHSGVGKSTLINGVEPGLKLKTGNVSNYHGKGRHTTTFAEMFPLSHGGFIIDTPGIKGFGIVELAKDELARYFPEMYDRLPDCKFNNCAHIEEPKCAVKNAVKAGEISASRYKNYLAMYHTDENENYR